MANGRMWTEAESEVLRRPISDEAAAALIGRSPVAVKYRRRLVLRGLCTRCGKQPAREGTSRCEPCHKHNRVKNRASSGTPNVKARHRRYQSRRKVNIQQPYNGPLEFEGVCGTCSRPFGDGWASKTLGHAIPDCKGGMFTDGNIFDQCKECNYGSGGQHQHTLFTEWTPPNPQRALLEIVKPYVEDQQ